MEEALFIVKTLTYVFTAVYVANFLRNMKVLAPNNKAIAILEYLFGLHILKKMPEFLGLTKQNNK